MSPPSAAPDAAEIAAVAREDVVADPVVLVVEDDVALATLFSSLLAREGFSVLVAHDGRVALEILAARPIACMLLDEHLPGMAGLALLRILRRRPGAEALRVIVVTGDDDPRRRIERVEAGADDHLTKPVLAEELVARVRSQLRSRAALVQAGQRSEEHAAAAAWATWTLAERGFSIAFQPIVDMATGAAVGYEALTRFDDLTRPDAGFARAHVAGLGTELELAAARMTMVCAADLPPDVFVSINVSPSLLLARSLRQLLEPAGRDVVVEITEHQRIDDYDAAREAIREIRPRVRVAVDDAGNGYASLTHVMELRPDLIKLDRAVLRGIADDPYREAMLAGLGAFAIRSGAVVVAEGVETTEELAAVRRAGIGLAQGYLLGRPVRCTGRHHGSHLGADESAPTGHRAEAATW